MMPCPRRGHGDARPIPGRDAGARTNAKYARRATSCPGAKMPKTPHSSRGPSRWSIHGSTHAQPPSRLAAGLDPFGEACVPRAARNSETASSSSPSMASVVAADLADHDKARQCLDQAGDDERSPRRLAERVEPVGQADRRTDPAGDADSARATATPPSAMSWALWNAPDRTRARTASWTIRQPAGSVGGSSPTGACAAQLAELGSDERGLERADERDRVALAREPHPPGPGCAGQLADHADHGRREDRPGRRLVVERDVAADDRDTERLARLGQSLDRLGQLPGHVRLLGVAEVQAVGQAERLGADAGEVGGALVDRLGRAAREDRRRLAGRCRRSTPRSRSPSGSTSTAASASSGRRTVRDWTIGSYCSNTGRREAMFAERSSASSVSAGDSSPVSTAAPAPRTDRSMAVRARGRTADNRRPAP